MAIPEESAVDHASARLRSLLDRARQLKSTTEIEPPLSTTKFSGEQGLPTPPNFIKLHYWAAVEDAARRVYQDRAASTLIEDPGFVEIWNLIDILSVCTDQDQCDPALAWWLIEELLETQSIDGCRIVFDYLESRRERLVGNLFKKKELIILRAFNELLRRLSRAEEAVFCGRVFVFLFQSFPLGDKSSVNPKGDFHKENLTTFEAIEEPPQSLDSPVKDEDMADVDAVDVKSEDTKPDTVDVKASEVTAESEVKTPKSPDRMTELLANENVLYSAFWTMQQAFSNPPEYFFRQNKIDEFKPILEATLARFRQVPKVNQAAADLRGVKRSVDELETKDQFANTFNPKYLTSRELFTLELSDLAFQRHILVQALILLDFLLSLTEKAKKKLASLPSNKGLHVDYMLGQTDADWVHSIRRSISSYLTDGQLDGDQEGKYYHRMVETVLSRDKNWVRWKLEFCKPIRQLPIHSDEFNSAQNSAKRICRVPAVRPSPHGALNLGFLHDAPNGGKDDTQNELARSELPDANTLVRDVQNVDLDLEMANTDEEKKELEDQKMSKTWRALRLMSKTKLNLFDKVDDGKNLECFIPAPVEEDTTGIEDGKSTAARADERNDGVEGKLEDEAMADEEARPETTTGAPSVPRIAVQ